MSLFGRAQVCGEANDPYEGVSRAIMPVPETTIFRWLGYDPNKPVDSSAWIQSDIAAMRLHGWQLWAGLTADSKEPARSIRPHLDPMLPKWETWYEASAVLQASIPTGPQNGAKLDLLSPEPPHRSPSTFSLPLELEGIQHPNNPKVRNASGGIRSDVVVQRVLYNQPACKQILNNHLGDPTSKDQILAKQKDVPDFDPDSMALKSVWMHVSAKGCDEIPVWDGLPAERGSTANDTPSWPGAVAVRTRSGQKCGEEKRLANLDDFYWHQITNTEADCLKISYGDQVKAGDFMVLVGMQVMTREIDNWVWATFWWHDHASFGDFAANRPGSTVVRGAWRHYLMDVAYDMDRPWNNGAPKAIFNPYLEAPLQDGTRSNCMTCHRRAVWPVPPNKVVTLSSNGEALDFRQVVVTGSEAATATYFPEYSSSLRLSFLWTLARPVGLPPCVPIAPNSTQPGGCQ
jgi:hypothetical protein